MAQHARSRFTRIMGILRASLTYFSCFHRYIEHSYSYSLLRLTTDLSRKLAQLHKENTAPLGIGIHKTNPRSILNTHKPRSHSGGYSGTPPQQQQANAAALAATEPAIGEGHKRLSMSDVSDMLFEYYKANAVKAQAPKNLQSLPVVKHAGQTSPTSAETHEPSTIAAIATNGAVVSVDIGNVKPTASKNLQSDGVVLAKVGSNAVVAAAASLHPHTEYTTEVISADDSIADLIGEESADGERLLANSATLRSIPTSVVVPTSPQIDFKPLIHPTTGLVISPNSGSGATTSVIKTVASAEGRVVVPQAAAIAAALLRDGYHNFQQQLRAQELLKHHSRQQLSQHQQRRKQQLKVVTDANEASSALPSRILESFLLQQREQQRKAECEKERDNTSDTNDGDDEDDSRFDDIHLVEGTKMTNFGNGALPHLFQSTSSPATTATAGGDYLSDESQKYMMAAQAQAMRNFEYTLGDYPGGGGGGGSSARSEPGDHGMDGRSAMISPNGSEIEPTYECRHCGKKYRWKSTLRRHENVECGGKEPSHQCPYCPYKSKQRGNLGVHVRKHHSNLPQLASKRRSKYSSVMNESSANGSDDSSSKLIIDFSK